MHIIIEVTGIHVQFNSSIHCLLCVFLRETHNTQPEKCGMEIVVCWKLIG